MARIATAPGVRKGGMRPSGPKCHVPCDAAENRGTRAAVTTVEETDPRSTRHLEKSRLGRRRLRAPLAMGAVGRPVAVGIGACSSIGMVAFLWLWHR